MLACLLILWAWYLVVLSLAPPSHKFLWKEVYGERIKQVYLIISKDFWSKLGICACAAQGISIKRILVNSWCYWSYKEQVAFILRTLALGIPHWVNPIKFTRYDYLIRWRIKNPLKRCNSAYWCLGKRISGERMLSHEFFGRNFQSCFKISCLFGKVWVMRKASY